MIRDYQGDIKPVALELNFGKDTSATLANHQFINRNSRIWFNSLWAGQNADMMTIRLSISTILKIAGIELSAMLKPLYKRTGQGNYFLISDNINYTINKI